MSRAASSRASIPAGVVPAAASVRDVRWTAVWIALPVALCWSYWPTLRDLLVFWSRNEDYSVGALVFPVAVMLVLMDRASLAALPMRLSVWGGAVIAFAELSRGLGLYYGIASLERYALVLCIWGAVLLSVGSAWVRRLAWKLLFLLLMVPLPARLHEAIALPLQDLATGSAVFLLELLGFLVVREGHVLRLDGGAVLAVQEACSGLRMLTAFIFVSAVLAFWVNRPFWQRTLLLASSIPIAIVANALRILVTAILADAVGTGQVVNTFHDIAGFAMMPLAMAAGLALLRLLDYLGLTPPVVAPPVTANRSARIRSQRVSGS